MDTARIASNHRVAAEVAESSALARLLDLGVTLGDPVTLSPEQRAVGHTMCSFHIEVTADGYDLDGGSATTILSLLTSGTYGHSPAECTLRPCR